MTGERTVRTRIAPSPTGYLHFGTARSALFNYLFAKKHNGAFLLRIEDTDTARNKPEYDADIFEQMTWLGLHADETYRQSERSDRHRAALERMLANNTAYESTEPAKDDPSRSVTVIRLRNPGKVVTFHDEIRGDISFDTTELGDMVIARSLQDPLYHLAVVVDDAEMDITHVIRGEDHISNTPRQILIQEALGYERPLYAHIPLILAPDRSKMSKRKHDTAMANFRAKGYYPEAMVNFLALLGWNPGTDQELFSMDELIAAFDLEKIQKSGAVFNEEKLRWFNRQYMERLDEGRFASELNARLMETQIGRLPGYTEERVRRIAPIMRERISVWGDIETLIADGELAYFFEKPLIEPAKLIWKESDAITTGAHLSHVYTVFEGLSEAAFADAEALKGALWDYATEMGRGAVLWPLRYALTGREKSPDPFIVASVLGKEETLERINSAKEQLA